MTERLRINAIYPCLQGEGAFTGTPMVLVRLAGCSVGCPWCDTKETWLPAPADERASYKDLIQGQPNWCQMTPREIEEAATDLAPGFERILLTGGEPCEQDLGPLIVWLHEKGWKVHLETSGTAPLPRPTLDWLTLSPKFGMPGGRKPDPAVLARTDELKMPVGKAGDIMRLEDFLGHGDKRRSMVVYLQPLAGSTHALDLCLSTTLGRGDWRLSLQVHKILGQP